MTAALAVAALVLALCLLGGLWAILRAPADVDRVLSVQLLGTTGVALVLVLGPAFGVRGTVEVALVLTLLAAVTTVVFARGGGDGRAGGGVGDFGEVGDAGEGGRSAHEARRETGRPAAGRTR